MPVASTLDAPAFGGQASAGLRKWVRSAKVENGFVLPKSSNGFVSPEPFFACECMRRGSEKGGPASALRNEFVWPKPFSRGGEAVCGMPGRFATAEQTRASEHDPCSCVDAHGPSAGDSRKRSRRGRRRLEQIRNVGDFGVFCKLNQHESRRNGPVCRPLHRPEAGRQRRVSLDVLGL